MYMSDYHAMIWHGSMFNVKLISQWEIPPWKLTARPLKMDAWKTTFLLGRPIFKGYVSFRECIQTQLDTLTYLYSTRLVLMWRKTWRTGPSNRKRNWPRRPEMTCQMIWWSRPWLIILWICPPPSNSPDNDYYIFCRESLYTFICVAVTGWGVDPNYSIHLNVWIVGIILRF